jgi:hypothetical protein
MRYTINILLFLLTCCNSISHKNDPEIIQCDDSLRLELSSIDYVVFESDSLRSEIFDDSYRIMKLSDLDMLDCESVLKGFIDQYNLKGERRLDSIKKYFRDVKHVSNVHLYEEQFHIELRNYGRQYIGVQSVNKHRIVYIIFFCDHQSNTDRNKEWIEVDDGGNCYFKMKIDLTEKRVLEYLENGL